MNLSKFKLFLLLSTISIFGSVSLLLTSVYSQDDATDSEGPKFLSIQHAESGSISKINATTYVLELNGISDKTILFSDRPDRIVTSITTRNFVGNWSAGADSFAVDAPNAVLVVDDLQEQDIPIIVLFDPAYDENKQAIRYEVTPDNATSIELPDEFGRSSLIIDAVNAQITD
jgi:hypothetical protein